MKIVITGGGSGGHIYPALSIIEGLKKSVPSVEVTYIGTTNRIEATMIPELGIDYIGLQMQGVNRKNIFKNFKLIYLLIKNYFILRKFYKQNNIDVVIGTGGYVTVPVVYTASKLKIPTLIFDADVNFGMATRKLLKHASVVCSGFKAPSEKHDNVIYTGNPRGQLISEKVKRSNASNKVLFIFGSLGSETLNDFFVKYFNQKDLEFDVKYVTGSNYYDKFVSELDNNRVEVVPYIDDIAAELVDVGYVVARSGATFVSELTSLAIPAIYIPSPYVANNEQVHNIEYLVKNDMSLMIQEQELTNEKFEASVKTISDNLDVISERLQGESTVDSLDIIVSKVKELVNE